MICMRKNSLGEEYYECDECNERSWYKGELEHKPNCSLYVSTEENDVIILRYCKRDMCYDINFSSSEQYCKYCGEVMDKRKFREVEE